MSHEQNLFIPNIEETFKMAFQLKTVALEFEKSFAPKIQDDADNLARMGTQYKTEAARGRAEAI